MDKDKDKVKKISDYRQIFDTINDIITIHDRDNNIIAANKAALEFLGLSRLEEGDFKCYRQYHGTDCPPDGCKSCDTITHELPVEFELLEPRLNKFIEVKCLPYKNDSGEIDGYIHIVRDISERKNNEEALRLFKNLVDSSKDGIVVIGREGVVEYCNGAILEILGYSLEEMKGKTLFETIVPKRFHEAKHRGMAHFFNTGEGPVIGKTLELVALHRNGQEIPVELTVSSFQSDHGWIAHASLRDISARKEYEAAVQESEERYRTIFEQNSDAAMLLDDKGFFDCNDATLKMFGLESKDEFVLHHPSELSPPLQPNGVDSMVMANGRIRAAMVEGHNRFEWVHRKKDGTDFPAEVWLTALPLGGKKVLYAVVRDISESRMIKEKLEQSLAATRTILEKLPVGMIIVGRDRIIRQVNPEAQKMMGYDSEEEIAGKICHNHICPAEECNCPVLDKGGLVDNSEKTLLRKDGTGIPILKTVVPITLEGEEVLLEAFVDVSEMKAAQEQLMIFRRFVETAGQGFGMVTLDGKILYANPAILRMVGVESLSQIVGTSFKEYYSVDRARQIDEISPKLLEYGQWYGEMELLTPDGRVIPTIENFFIIKNEKNEPICFANIITDNTERKKWEREILEAKEKADAARDSAENAARETEKARLEAERANRSKSDFLANMSHEIRTPMNAIIGFTDILKSGSHTEEEEEYLDHIKNSGNHLLSLINDILDLSKIEAGRVEVDESPFDLRCVIKDTFNLVRLRMEEKELKSRLLFDENIPPYFIGDEKHLRQIILNLLSNAVKFTDKGSISVTVTESVEHGYNEPDYEFFTGGIVGQTMEDRCLDGDYFPVSITVADTGIGIARDKLGSIFDPFDRGSSSTSRSFEGTGLGLAITKRLVQMLGGRIGVESTPGRGSTFKVELPFKMVQDVSLLKEIRCGRTDGEDEISIQGIKSKPRDDKEDQYSVLVIEDDEASARLIELSLAQSGFRIFKASSGSKAFPILAREKIDLILLDIILPGMSGWDILRSLKQSVKYSGIPVVICSVLDEAKKGFSLGAVEYIEKPIDMKDLVARVEGLLTDQSRKRKIAIIEDEPDVMELLKTYFTRHNYDVAAFLNAEDALHHIKEFRDVDVIILDLMMPGMNGFEFLDNFQENIPVLVYTAKELTTEDFRILKAYFCRILHKGESSLGELGSEIAKIMSQQGRQVLGAGQKKEYDKFVKDRRRGTAILHESKTSARTTSELVQGRILLVEDNIVNQKLIKTYLKNYPFDVQVAGDGEEGVMRATGEQFDLILMDIQMPKLDGYGATEKIREHEAGTGKRVPIIALTAYAMKGDEERVLQGGFDGYLSKPIEKEKFFEAIGKYLRGRPASPKVLPKAPAPLKKLDPQVEKMVPWFVGILKKNLDKMKKSLEENDLPALGVMGHNLKGNASSFGFDEVAALGSSMEASATAQDAASLKKDVARLEEIVASLLKDFPPG